MRRRVPLVTGSLIAVAGLVFGGVSTAYANGSSSNASPNHRGGPPKTDPIPLPDAPPPLHGDAIPNVTTVEQQIKAYYGSVPATLPVVGDVTLPSPTSNYAHEVEGIASRSESLLKVAIRPLQRAHVKPALIFDVDDTTLNTYDYEIAQQFGYTPASNAVFVNAGAFPAVFGMPELVNWAGSHGYTVFFITGRPEAQRAATSANLSAVGYNVPLDTAHLYLKQPTPPSYLHCAAAPTCTTIEYKSGTRAHIESMGYRIVADFGDQFSDLKGGHAGVQVKLPNPMYYLP
jgi:hypothetical protein